MKASNIHRLRHIEKNSEVVQLAILGYLELHSQYFELDINSKQLLNVVIVYITLRSAIINISMKKTCCQNADRAKATQISTSAKYQMK